MHLKFQEFIMNDKLKDQVMENLFFFFFFFKKNSYMLMNSWVNFTIWISYIVMFLFFNRLKMEKTLRLSTKVLGWPKFLGGKVCIKRALTNTNTDYRLYCCITRVLIILITGFTQYLINNSYCIPIGTFSCLKCRETLFYRHICTPNAAHPICRFTSQRCWLLKSDWSVDIVFFLLCLTVVLTICTAAWL